MSKMTLRRGRSYTTSDAAVGERVQILWTERTLQTNAPTTRLALQREKTMQALARASEKDPRLGEADNACPICTDNITNTTHLDCCQHQYCRYCIGVWTLNTSSTCPLCKKVVSLLTSEDGSVTRVPYRKQRTEDSADFFFDDELSEESSLSSSSSDIMPNPGSDNSHTNPNCTYHGDRHTRRQGQHYVDDANESLEYDSNADDSNTCDSNTAGPYETESESSLTLSDD